MTEKTYNPIHSSRPYENGIFAKIPFPAPGFAIVLTGNQATPLLIQNNMVPSKGQIRRGNYNWMTQVNIRPHDVAFEAELLSKDNISRFHIAMQMSAQVEFPDQACADNITDVVSVVKSSLLPKLQNQASQRVMAEIQQFREEILFSLGSIVRLPSGILLTNISLWLTPDQAYIDQQAKIGKLYSKMEYERVRAGVAQDLSKLYENPVDQVFAEFAADRITAEEAADRLREKSFANFDETLRRFRELFKTAEEVGVVSPAVLENKANQLFTLMLNDVTPIQNADVPSHALEDGTEEQYLFAPPEE